MIRSRFFIGGLIASGFLVVATCLWVGVMRQILAAPVPATSTVYYYIPPGTGLLRASYLAGRDKLVRAPWHFMAAVRWLGREHSLFAGEYEVRAGQSLSEVLGTIERQERHHRRLVVPEGRSVAEIKAILSGSFGLEGADAVKAEEGSLLPDTYFYDRGMQAEAVVRRMKSAMNEELARLWQGRADGLPFDSPDDALVLASIVEKETGVAAERRLVAAVFVNRLKRGMRLQSDPTVTYGITGGLPLDRALTSADLREVTPYNTYRIGGLPPTPIANPGRAALEAVLAPADVDYLYFVADGSGGHAFARTLEEHNRNVARWRQFRQKSR